MLKTIAVDIQIEKRWPDDIMEIEFECDSQKFFSFRENRLQRMTDIFKRHGSHRRANFTPQSRKEKNENENVRHFSTSCQYVSTAA
jgi:hypothetical protein